MEVLDKLACKGSATLFGMVGATALTAPQLSAVRAVMAEQAPWIFGCAETETPLAAAWNATVSDPAVVGNEWKRWPFPARPGQRTGAWVEAIKS